MRFNKKTAEAFLLNHSSRSEGIQEKQKEKKRKKRLGQCLFKYGHTKLPLVT
jgi:low temperature requirement protein LtrA